MNKRIYFPNLDGLRFIAASMVVFPHIEQIKSLLGLDYSYSIYPYECGKLGVILFFVLSGYLITYLLLVEKRVSGDISIKKFYIRRILRIWPLYYLIVILGIFVFPHIDILDYGGYTINNLSTKNKIIYLLFLPNIAIYIPYIAQTWSVGVEEQFYLIWPWLIKYINNKYSLFVSIILGYLLLYYGFALLDYHIFKILSNIIIWLRIDSMAIGAIFALILYKKEKILIILYSNYLQFLIYLLISGLLISKIVIPFVHFQIFAILFGIVILNLSSNEKTIIQINGKVINYLGRISYGLYIYHPVVITLVLIFLNSFGLNYTVIQYCFSLLLSLAISHYSYILFENKFIKMKTKFSIILSGKNIKK